LSTAPLSHWTLSRLSDSIWKALQRVAWSELCTSLQQCRDPGRQAAAQHSSHTLTERVEDSTSLPEVLLLVSSSSS
jgi:hypothetical protein